jgi:catenin alpha
VNKCIAAVQEQDAETLDRTAGAIQGRVTRVTDVVSSEMNEYEPGVYTEYVMDAVKDLREQGNFNI